MTVLIKIRDGLPKMFDSSLLESKIYSQLLLLTQFDERGLRFKHYWSRPFTKKKLLNCLS
jgi:hypothetical protein